LGAGDTFRAGVVYGVLRDMEDPEIVQFAAACAAVACTRFPSDYEAPALEEINHLISIRTEHLPFS
jgi:sugar/nucleoside kinase (ribokinase family)